MSDDVTFLSQIVRDSMEIQAQETLDKTDDPELDVLKPLQVLTHANHLNIIAKKAVTYCWSCPTGSLVGGGWVGYTILCCMFSMHQKMSPNLCIVAKHSSIPF